MTFFITILIIGGLIYLLTRKKGSQKQAQPKANNRQGHFESNIPNLVFPDRTDAIEWHSQAIKKGFQNGDLELANLSYAKLIES
ncbi:MAG: hypothetical protein K9I85_15770, partial [Saprospiraceae bacterium]|nr:hypothetical protein [Saprospiraceae bacterium]